MIWSLNLPKGEQKGREEDGERERERVWKKLDWENSSLRWLFQELVVLKNWFA